MENTILDINETTNLENAKFAGFWIRFFAHFIDSMILLAVQSVINLIGMGSMMNTMTDGLSAGYVIVLFVNAVIGVLYFVLMESSEKKATVGKMAIGIYVVDEKGDRISIGKAFGRYFSKILSALILCIGFIMIAFTNKNQGLHDRMAGTYVIRK